MLLFGNKKEEIIFDSVYKGFVKQICDLFFFN